MLSYASRTNLHIAFLDRPLVMALLFGFCTDNMPLALATALFFELFWIDLLRLGIIVPVSGTFSFLLFYPLCIIFQWQLPTALPLPLCMCLFFGHAAPLLERWQRSKNAAYDSALEDWVEHSKPSKASDDLLALDDMSSSASQGMSPAEIISRSRWRMLWSSALLYFSSFALLYGIFYWLKSTNSIPSFSYFTWYMLYGLALIGPILALRTRPAYKVLAFGFALLLVFLFVTQ